VLDWPYNDPLVGRQAIREAFRRHTHAPLEWHKHLLFEPLVDIDGDRARVTSYYMRMDRYDDGPHARSFGRYLDELVRCSDGRWRFAHRVTENEARTARMDPVRARARFPPPADAAGA
jgi:ketosteroid isomerase-like protein